ncbi:hypothetical protein FKP32DRAFT_182094 [Trametes sanguinea]|nr:hypothetical protein FKP32DRAFT_182094 [Trametes sanguinea]
MYMTSLAHGDPRSLDPRTPFPSRRVTRSCSLWTLTMRRFLSRSRSVPIAAPEWQCPGKLAHSSSMSSALSAASSPSYGSEDSSRLEETLDDGVQDGRSTPSGRQEPVSAASHAKDCSCSSLMPDRRHTVSEILDSRSPPVEVPATHNARQDCCFKIVKKWSPSIGAVNEPATRIIIHDPYLLTVCEDLMPGCSSSSSSAIEFDLNELLGLLPQLEDYRDGVRDHASRRDTDDKKLKAVSALANFLRKEHQGRFDKLDAHISRGEITFDGLFAIFVPRTTVISKCATTGEWRAYRLKSANRVCVLSMDVYHLIAESIDVVDDDLAHCDCCSVSASRPRTRGSVPANTLRRVQSSFLIPRFDGVAAICSLQMFPLRYHPDAEILTTSLVARGKRWVSLQGVHHMHYTGFAAYTLSVGNCKTTVQYEVCSPIIVDRVNFRRLNPGHDTAATCDNLSSKIESGPLGPDELSFAPATVYGYSLANQKWRESRASAT